MNKPVFFWQKEIKQSVTGARVCRGTLRRSAVDRVRDSLRFTMADGVHEVDHPGKGLQQAGVRVSQLVVHPLVFFLRVCSRCCIVLYFARRRLKEREGPP